MKKKINIILLLVWMSFIFIMSHQTGSESSATSESVLNLFAFLRIDIESTMGELLHFGIRKGAHLFEYFILSLLFYKFIKEYINSKLTYALPVLFSFFYACTDEFHQMFVPNRGPSFIDVLIDTTGAIVAMLIVIVFNKWTKHVECE